VVSATARQNDALRTRILDAATDLFQQDGYQGTTADDISESANITKRTLYKRMGDKETILFEVHDRFLSDLREALDGVPTSEHKLHSLAKAHLDTITNHQSAIRVFYEETKHLSPLYRARIVSRRQEYWHLVQDIIRDEVAAGIFRKINVRIAAHTILGALNESYRWYRPDGSLPPHEIADFITDLFTRGLLTEQVELPPLNPAPAPEVELSGKWVANPTLAAILAAATVLFSRNGYTGTTTREIAEQLDMTKALLYYHIHSKDELLVQIIDRMNKIGVAAAEQIVSSEPDPVRCLQRLIVMHAEQIVSQSAAFTVFNEDYKYLSAENRALLSVDRDKYADLWQEVIIAGQRSGALRQINPRLTMLTILGSLNAIYRWYQKSGRLSAREIGSDMADIILFGLQNKPLGPGGNGAAATR
jgi:AcrR family transcriptional regulator